MGANLCRCLHGGDDQENYRGRGRGSVKKSMPPRTRIRRMHSFPPPPLPPPPPRDENSCKVMSLKDLIAASPCNGAAISYGVDNENERESEMVGMKRRERGRCRNSSSKDGKLKKRVSFRSPQVADILVVSPVTYL